MEGFLQGCKFESIDMQKHVCTLVGFTAKKAGRNKKWWEKQTLYWLGKPMKRESDDYQNLLNRAYNAMYTQSTSFRNALIASNKATLGHSIGRTDINKTVLTVREFCSRLTQLRDTGLLPFTEPNNLTQWTNEY
jgi:hypothetical protein